MNSKIKIIRETKKDKVPLRVDVRDLILIESKGKEYLVRVTNTSVNEYILYALEDGNTTIFRIEKRICKELRVGDIVETIHGSEVTILGICDVDITITNIRTHEE